MQQTSFSPRDLLLAHRWSSLLFTTYSLSLSFVEAIALSAVSRTYRRFTVLADIAGYRSSLADAGAIGVGRDYEVVPIAVRGGVFHPKIALVADEEGTIRATVGSGNLTFGGWGYNTEVLEMLVPGPDSNCFSDLAAFLQALASDAGPGERFETERALDINRFTDICRMASRVPGAGNSRLLHTILEPLDVQLGRMTTELGGATALTVVSPFFSTHLGVMRLASALSCERVSVSVPPVAPSIFDFDSCRAAGFSVSPVTCDLFTDTRSLHAKLFDIECRNGRIVVSGSANATTAALSGRNVEAVVARVADSGTKLGWRPSGTHTGHATGERQPEEQDAGPCIVAHFDGTGIEGRIFGLAEPEGEWLASLSSGTRRDAAGSVSADAVGRFRFLAPDGIDPIALASSAQVIFERGGDELRGWLVLQDLLHAIRERGPVARSFGRIMSGTATAADATAILEYLAKAPATFIDAADRQGGGRKDRSIAVRPPGLTLAPADLRPVDAFDMPTRWTGGGVSQAFDTLLDALVRHFASSLPDAGDLAGDDEDDADEPAAHPAKRGSGPAKRGKRVPVKLAIKAFDAMFAMLERRPVGSGRVPGLYSLFDMMVQIAPRCDESDELIISCSARWLAAAQGCRSTEGEFTDLDRCVAMILTKYVMDDPTKAVRSHVALQRWLGGELTEAAILALEPDAEHLDARRLVPGAVQQGWSAAWRTIVSTSTPWSMANALVASLSNGDTPSLPKEVTKEEAAILRAVADGRSKPDRIAIVNVGQDNRACPRCHIVLPHVQRARINSVRIATCGNFRCNRIIVDISL